MMHMTFYWGRRVTILFDSWRTDTWTSYFLSLLACFLVSAFYQYMENRRLRFRILAKNSPAPPSSSSVTTPLLAAKYAGKKFSPARFAEAGLFGVNSAIGYMLMLAVMSFNGGVFVAVVAGLGVGYLVFRGGDDVEDVFIVDSPCACA